MKAVVFFSVKLKINGDDGSLLQINCPVNVKSFHFLLFFHSSNSFPLLSVTLPPTVPFVLPSPIYHGVKVERDIIMGCRAGERRQR